MSGEPPPKKQKSDAAAALLLLNQEDLPDVFWEDGEWHVKNDVQMQEAEAKEREMWGSSGLRMTIGLYEDTPVGMLETKRRARQFYPGEEYSDYTTVTADGDLYRSDKYKFMTLPKYKFRDAFYSAMFVRAKVLTARCWYAEDLEDAEFRNVSLAKADFAFVKEFVTQMETPDPSWNPPAANMRNIYLAVAHAAVLACPIDFELMGDEEGPDYTEAYDTAMEEYSQRVGAAGGGGGAAPKKLALRL